LSSSIEHRDDGWQNQMGSNNTGIGMTRMAWMVTLNRWRGQESDAKVAFITDLAAEWAYEKNSVKDGF
jgi:hypothetical protein